MLSTCAWNLSRMLGYQELTNACDVVMNPTGLFYNKNRENDQKINIRDYLSASINSTLFDLNITLL